jgi:type IX secretion system PorP/SprF family membrane protein
MTQKKYISLFVLALSVKVFAQDPQFTQFYNTPMFLNPALAGSSDAHRFTATYRNQWPGVKKAFSNYMASYDYNLDKYNAGVGAYVMQDVAGTGNLVTTQGGLNLAYRVAVGRWSEVRGGVQVGYAQKKTDVSKLVFNDQFITGSSVSEDAGSVNNVNYLDLGAGAVFKSDNFWGGFSVKHLNKPNVSMTGSTSPLPASISVHGGYKFILHESDTAGGREKSSLNPVWNYRHMYGNDQLDIGVYYFYKLINFGVMYRGIPVKTYAPGYQNNESVAILAGVDIPDKRIKVGYSYDVTVSALSLKNSSGAHEICLMYEFGKASGKKVATRPVKKGSQIRRKF